MSNWKETEIGRIPSHWRVGTIDEIAAVVTDGAHSSPKQFIGGRYMASVKDMTYDKFVFTDCKTIREDDFQKLKKQGCSPQKGDILISKDGEKCLDLIFVYNQVDDIVLLSSIAIVRLKDGFNPYFYRYFLLSYVAQTIMYKWFRSGSAIPRVVLRDFKKVPVPIMDKREQDEIANKIQKLDQKITLLREQNKTLEELAQTLFKRWFVENENPEWELKSLSEIVNIKIGRTPPRKEEQWFSRSKEDVKWVSIKDLGKSGVYILKTSEFLTQEAVDKYKIPLIQENTVLLSFKMTLGRVGIATETMVSNEAIAQFVPKRKEITPEFLYFYLKTFKYQKLGSTSSIVTSINSGMIKDMPVTVPDKDSLSHFSIAVKTIFDKIKSNTKEIQSLTQLRDTLLPKLISGELRVIS
ncbi:restriction endonuclease subunit S [Arenibacter troitsensis]|uniref:Type I restriction enzyme, S subunit n=1 Tax=Arenibacter troitsensis TaxID=188872 RepID=A0A1X7KW89_9FLAO|nr:restriction endonuclease subunit S [Arenibacter troitsensis]SMG45126.1 type I restriction enzyme, S subunit [Arenibacter troitsensis]